ncbi:CDP-alcohol phosphatidyltransferase family protein [Actinotalea sp. M2MS4P-6]|uniref:CDP-alcohol phosphatidyltransferase family protein n=1 Tax=Actinotalea sp. M2MS4P-6 TaxID=2983762 RepID=UPI0021E44817|nr:CDP-alcohol phosphatidyltransferase family protein [Actinotalea sp. M2MS4P-6]MCV2395818.1 CDP-alcohol phosphatidyltransferase family protein [Actinotalea sp. M2MS4P-6]
MSYTFSQALAALGGAQKAAARGAPAYSRFVNRRLGRVLAAAAAVVGLTPNGVTGISALFTFSGIAVLALAPVGLLQGVTVTVLLVLGYAFDSADGQLARLRGGGSPAGEWLDHVVDSIKVVALPLAVLLALRRTDLSETVLLVPLAAAVVQSVSFFTMILTEQLRRAHGTVPLAASGGAGAWVRTLVAVPTDYGVQCYLFVLLAWPVAFAWGYGVVVVASAGYLLLATVKWYREMRGLGRPSAA